MWNRIPDIVINIIFMSMLNIANKSETLSCVSPETPPELLAHLRLTQNLSQIRWIIEDMLCNI